MPCSCVYALDVMFVPGLPCICGRSLEERCRSGFPSPRLDLVLSAVAYAIIASLEQGRCGLAPSMLQPTSVLYSHSIAAEPELSNVTRPVLPRLVVFFSIHQGALQNMRWTTCCRRDAGRIHGQSKMLCVFVLNKHSILTDCDRFFTRFRKLTDHTVKHLDTLFSYIDKPRQCPATRISSSDAITVVARPRNVRDPGTRGRSRTTAMAVTKPESRSTTMRTGLEEIQSTKASNVRTEVKYLRPVCCVGKIYAKQRCQCSLPIACSRRLWVSHIRPRSRPHPRERSNQKGPRH